MGNDAQPDNRWIRDLSDWSHTISVEGMDIAGAGYDHIVALHNAAGLISGLVTALQSANARLADMTMLTERDRRVQEAETAYAGAAAERDQALRDLGMAKRDLSYLTRLNAYLKEQRDIAEQHLAGIDVSAPDAPVKIADSDGVPIRSDGWLPAKVELVRPTWLRIAVPDGTRANSRLTRDIERERILMRDRPGEQIEPNVGELLDGAWDLYQFTPRRTDGVEFVLQTANR